MNLASVTGESIKSKTISEYLEQTYRKKPTWYQAYQYPTNWSK